MVSCNTVQSQLCNILKRSIEEFVFLWSIDEFHNIFLLPIGEFHCFCLRPIAEFHDFFFCNWLLNFTFYLQSIDKFRDFSCNRLTNFTIFFCKHLFNFQNFSHDFPLMGIFFICLMYEFQIFSPTTDWRISLFFPMTNWRISRFYLHDWLTNFAIFLHNQWTYFVIFSTMTRKGNESKGFVKKNGKGHKCIKYIKRVAGLKIGLEPTHI